MQELIGTWAEVVGAVHKQPRLLDHGQRTTFVLAGEFDRTLASGEEVREVFFQPCCSVGRLAGRLGTLPKGVALCLAGPLVYGRIESNKDAQFLVNVTDAARLPDHGDRLGADRKDGMRLFEGHLRTRLRGVIAHTPHQRQLMEGESVVNARLGLTLKNADPDQNRYAFLEVAAYGPALGDRLFACQQGDMVTVWGILQHRRTADGEGWFQRIEITALERLHPGRAVV